MSYKRKTKDDQAKDGKWTEWFPGDCSLIMTGEEMLYACSICDAKFAKKHDVCPFCHANMK